MDNIKKYSKINQELLSKEFYFQSLLKEAYTQEELNDLQIQNIQMQCLKLLADNTDNYNKGQSSSVMFEVAQSIMASTFYAISIYLKSLPDISSALDDIINKPITDLYWHGRKMIDTKLNTAKQLYQFVCSTKIESSNLSYNSTIEEGITIFFKKYNANFESHETPASIDYQLMNPVDGLVGVEYMIEYLQNLYMENLFCSLFSADIIHEVMRGYNEDYKDLLVNIFEQVLQNALGCTLLDKELLSLNLIPANIQELKGILSEHQELIWDFLQRASDKVIQILAITSPPLVAYIHQSLPEIALRIHSAINSNSLQTIFVPRCRQVENQAIHYSMGIKMDNQAYRQIVDELLSCRYSDDKLQIINEHIKTLADLEDIIIDGELSEAEAMAVLNKLDDVEIAILAKRHSPSSKIDSGDLPGAEKLWGYLENHLGSRTK